MRKRGTVIEEAKRQKVDKRDNKKKNQSENTYSLFSINISTKKLLENKKTIRIRAQSRLISPSYNCKEYTLNCNYHISTYTIYYTRYNLSIYASY